MKARQGGLIVLLGMGTVLNMDSASAVIRRDDQPDSAYLSTAAGSEYASVGLFVNSWGYTGSGMLIAPDWVLTAAHNLVAASSATFTLNGLAYTSTQLILNPGWNNDPFHGYDFGLVHLSSPVTNAAPATLYTGSSELNQLGTYVGFGFTGTGLTGYQNVDGLKRAFQNMIDGDFGNPGLVYGSDFDNPHSATNNTFGDATPLPLEGCVAPGDSGGGLFLTIGPNTYLAGVISFVAATDGSANGNYGDLSGFGRISSVLPWINSTIPEPSAPLLLAAAGVVGCLARHRSRGG